MHRACFIGLCTHLDDVALFNWLVQTQDGWLSTTKKLLNSRQTLCCMRGQGLGTRLWVDVVRHILGPSSLMPRPHLSWGKGSGDYWVISWLCWINSLDFWQANETGPTSSKHVTNVYIKSILLTWQTQNNQNQLSPDPFPHERWGLGMRLVGTIVPRPSPTLFPWLHTWTLNPWFSGFPALQSPFICIALSG